MRQFVASTSISKGSLWLYIDNNLITNNGEQIAVDLEVDGYHIVHWYIEGEPGGSYTITISSPRNAEFQLTKIVGPGGKDFGGFLF